MKKLITLLTTFFVSLLLSLSAFGGRYDPFPLIISGNVGGTVSASGSISAVRFSKNDVEEIGCRLLGVAGSFSQVQCQAVDVEGVSVACVSTDPNIVAAAQAITTYSWLQFTIEDAVVTRTGILFGDCVTLIASSKSFHIPNIRDQNPGRN